MDVGPVCGFSINHRACVLVWIVDAVRCLYLSLPPVIPYRYWRLHNRAAFEAIGIEGAAFTWPIEKHTLTTSRFIPLSRVGNVRVNNPIVAEVKIYLAQEAKVKKDNQNLLPH
jgi:hypothetical protein